ncbi:TPA: hypothetical protein U7J97_001200 [Streptococcus agalactiae]|nr:hypothetical protein [Streptococcus agalactiae]HEN7498922.1 hypothetical protein [Streptococcus agalactiae]
MTHVVRVYEHIGGRVLPTVYKDKEFKTKDEFGSLNLTKAWTNDDR